MEELRKRGLHLESIAALGVYTETNSHEIDRLRKHYTHRTQAYGAPDRLCPNPATSHLGHVQVIPYPNLIDAEGKEDYYYRIRPDKPQIDVDRRTGKKKPRKYEGPKGVSVRAYFPGNLPAIFDDPSYPLCITEGEYKAAVMNQFGFATIGIGGVAMWSRKRKYEGETRWLSNDLQRVVWDKRTVFIVFDSDIRTNKDVAREANTLRESLTSLWCRAHIVYLPTRKDGQKVGADDYLIHAEGGPDRLEALIQRRHEPRFKRSHNNMLICPQNLYGGNARAYPLRPPIPSDP